MAFQPSLGHDTPAQGTQHLHCNSKELGRPKACLKVNTLCLDNTAWPALTGIAHNAHNPDHHEASHGWPSPESHALTSHILHAGRCMAPP